AAGVDELLLARVERVTRRADLDVELGLGRSRRELVPAGAGHVGDDVLGVDVGLHRDARISEAISGPTLPPETTATTAEPGIRAARTAGTAGGAAGAEGRLAWAGRLGTAC